MSGSQRSFDVNAGPVHQPLLPEVPGERDRE